MILTIQKHIKLGEKHPQLPDWLFNRDNVILSQTIRLDEVHMKELLVFIDMYSDFDIKSLTLTIVPFEDILLEYA
jgi:hypothetical protein